MSHPSVRPERAVCAALAFAILPAAFGSGCGKKGPPLPPLVKIPAAPSDLMAERRGSSVRLQFTVPAANTDGTRPANVERVDVYGFTGSRSVADEQLFKSGTKIGSVPVKAPRNPNDTTDPDEPDDEEEMDPLEGQGWDQGAVVHVEETLTPAALVRTDQSGSRQGENEGLRPLLGPLSFSVPTRTYVTVGITTRGRRGATSRRVAVPLGPPPPSPSMPTITYDEKTITLAWAPPAVGGIQLPATGDLLPARPIGLPAPTLAYNVYEVSPPPASGTGDAALEARLTKTPIPEVEYADNRIQWDVERCYAVRTVETIEGLSVEGAPSPAACEKLVDTFPPAAPRGLTAVASQNAISLIWQPDDAKDLAGYLVLRGAAPGDTMQPLTPAPIQDTTYTDTVRPGVRYVYVVRAVDKAGNVGPASNRAEETAHQ